MGVTTFNQLLLIPQDKLTGEQKLFLEVHNETVAAGQKAAECMLIFIKDLQMMKEKELYKTAGFADFKDYVEKALNIKERQAATWISILKLPCEYLEKNSEMGVSKLALIAAASEPVSEELMNDQATAEKSYRELKAIIKERETALKEKDKQINLLSEELEAANDKLIESEANYKEIDTADYDAKIKELTAQLEAANKDLEAANDKLEESEAKIDELSAREPEVITETIEKTVEVENPETQKALKEAQSAAEAALSEKRKAEEEARKYQTELANYKKTQEAVAAFKVHAGNLFESWDTVIEAIERIKEADKAYASKCLEKLQSFSETVISDIAGVQQ